MSFLRGTKHLHLALSSIVVIMAALVYGSSPQKLLPLVFDFSIDNLELKNIFKAVMGLYMAFAIYWIVGIFKQEHWRHATLSNILFMGGLAFGRIISLVIDGISTPFTIGLILELLVMIWGFFNLKNENFYSKSMANDQGSK